MVRQWVLFTIYASAAFAASPPSDISFRPGREYVYEYETHVLSGIPAAANQFAGLKVKANVRLQVKSGSVISIKMGDIKLCRVNNELSSKMLLEPLPQDVCTQVTGLEADVITEQLIKPIHCRYEEGRVSELEVSPEEPHWSVNLKRGVLSLLNLNMLETEALPDVPEELYEDLILREHPRRSLNKFYRTMEPDLVGDCETVYAIDDTDRLQETRMFVTKVRNYDRCRHKPVWKEGIVTSLDCTSCHEDQKPLRTLTHTEYELSGNRRDFLIQSVKLQSKIVFTPLSEKDGQAVTYISQVMHLLRAHDIEDPIRPERHLVTKPVILMEIPTPSIPSPESDVPSTIPQTQVDAKIILAEKLLEKIASHLSPVVRLEAPHQVAELIGVLRDLPYHKLQEWILDCTNIGQTTDPLLLIRKEVLLDILPSIGRCDVINIITRLIENDIISHERAALMINLMAVTAHPAPECIMDLLSMYRSRMVKGNILLARSVLLSSGIMSHNIHKLHEAMQLPKELRIPTKHKIVDKFRSLLADASGEEEKISIVKAIGNAGLTEFISDLREVAEDRFLSPKLRTKAIYAMRKMTPLASSTIHTICLPLYLDEYEPQPVRLAAFLITINSHPSGATIQLLAHKLESETSLNMASFVYTYLSELAHSKDPCLYNVSIQAKFAIKSVKPALPGIQYSRVFKIQKFAEMLKQISTDMEVHLVNSGEDVIPDTIVSKVFTTLCSSKINWAEVGIESRGLTPILENIIGPNSIVKDIINGKVSLKDILEPLKSGHASVESTLRRMFEKMSVKERGFSDLDVSLYLRLLDQEMAYLHLDKSAISSMIEKVGSKLPEILRRLKDGYKVDVTKTLSMKDSGLILPTPCGLPVSINVTSIGLARLSGVVRVEGISSPLDLIKPGPKPDVTVHANLKPSAAVEVSGKMGVELCHVKAMTTLSARVQAQLPIKSKLHLSPDNGKTKFIYYTPQEEETILHHDFVPATMTEVIFLRPENEYSVKDIKQVFNPTLVIPKPFHTIVGEELLGLPVEIKGVYTKKAVPFTPIRPLCSKHELKLVIKPDYNTPQSIETEVLWFGRDMFSPKTRDSREYLSRREENRYSESRSSESVEESSEEEIDFGRMFSSPRHYPQEEVSFDRVQPDSQLLNPSKREVFVTVIAKGQRRRELKVKLTHICDDDLLKHQLNVQILADTPALSTENKPFKIDIDSLLVVPPVLLTEPSLATPKTLLKLEVKYGPAGYTRTLCNIKINYDVIQETSKFYKEHGRSQMESPEQWETVWTKKSPKFLVNPKPIMELNEYSTTPFYLQFECTCDLNKLPSFGKEYMMKVYHYLLDLPIILENPTISVEMTPDTNPHDQIMLTIYYWPRQKTLDLEIRSPPETDVIKGIPFPCPLMILLSPSHVPFYNRMLHHGTDKKLFPAKCEMTKNNQVKTFDRKVFDLEKVSLRGCEAILSQDCSSRRTFSITAKPLREDPSRKMIRIYVGRDIIEVGLVSSGGWLSWSPSLNLLINGEKKELSTAPISIYSHHQSKPLCHAKKVGQAVEVACEGFTVETDCKYIKILTSTLLSGRVCGLCGDLNGEMRDEYRGPDMTLHPSPEHFISSYLIESDTCDVRTIKLEIESKESRERYDQECMKESRTVVIEKLVSGEKKLCFSIEPVPKCKGNCRSVNEYRETRAFHCLPANDESSFRMVAKANKMPLHLNNKPVHTSEDVIAQPQCIPLY